MKTEIVNVVEIFGGILSGIDSFVITNKKTKTKIVELAEKKFADKAKENGMKSKDLEICLDKGVFENENYSVCVSWSNLIKK